MPELNGVRRQTTDSLWSTEVREFVAIAGDNLMFGLDAETGCWTLINRNTKERLVLRAYSSDDATESAFLNALNQAMPR